MCDWILDIDEKNSCIWWIHEGLTYAKKYKDIINLGKTKGEDRSQNEELIELKTEEEKNINNYLMSLVKEEIKLDEKKCEYINEYIKKKPDNIKLVMDILLNQLKNSSFIKVNNLENLNLLSQLL